MLTGVCYTVGIGVARVTVFLRVIIFCDRTSFASLRSIAVTAGCRCALTTERTTTVAAATLRLRRSTTAFLRIRRRGTGRRFATCRCSCFLFRRACPRVSRIADSSERAWPTSSVRSVIVGSRRFLPQIIELDDFGLKLISVSIEKFSSYY